MTIANNTAIMISLRVHRILLYPSFAAFVEVDDSRHLRPPGESRNRESDFRSPGCMNGGRLEVESDFSGQRARRHIVGSTEGREDVRAG